MLAPCSKAVDRDSAAIRKEKQITHRILIEMNRMCAEYGVPFMVLILMEAKGERFLPDVTDDGVAVIDLILVSNDY